MPCAVSEKIIQDLINHVEKEEERSSSLPTSSCKKEYVQAEQRDSSINSLLKLNTHFGFEPETFCLAVRYVDTFLAKVKVSPKYLEVISLSALVLAAKLGEEDEFIPDTEDFVTVSRSVCTVADVVRMERIMIEKLDWNMYVPTPLTFIEKYCNILEAYGLFNEEEKRSIVQHCIPTLVNLLSNSSFLNHKSSTIALTILNYELSFFNREISSIFCELSNYSKIHDSELMHCNLLLQEFLDSQLLAMCKEKRTKKKRTHSTSSVSSSKRTMPTIWEAGDELMSDRTESSFSNQHISEKEEDTEHSSYSMTSDVDPCSDDTDPISDMDGERDEEGYGIEDIKCDSPVTLSAFSFPDSESTIARPLYSQIVKKSSVLKKSSCASEAYDGHLVQTSAATGRAC